MPKKVLMTVGPIPAKLDSVKFVTNRFKGGLALKTAHYLADAGNDVTIVAWKFADLTTTLPVVYVEDVLEYYRTVLAFKADAYVLAAAVANLMPSHPYEGKFPSHQYQVGQKFNVEFEIAPRVIDDLKKAHPRSTLIGYKLYDGTDEELIAAGKKTLHESTANLVFANHPSWAKHRKIALTQDGAVFECDFNAHCALMHKLINETFYQTTVMPAAVTLSEDEQFVLDHYPRYAQDGRVYGTFAVKRAQSFITTTRGKKQGAVCEVTAVDHAAYRISASAKATLNAPLLARMFELNPTFTILLHGHTLMGKAVHPAYEFPGTSGDLHFGHPAEPGEAILLTQHGYLVGFETVAQMREYLERHALA